MTRTHADHETILAPYYDPDTGLIDTRQFIRDFNTDGIAAVYGPMTNDPNEETLRIAYEHNRIVKAERGEGAAITRDTERGAWLAWFVSLLAALAGIVGVFGTMIVIA